MKTCCGKKHTAKTITNAITILATFLRALTCLAWKQECSMLRNDEELHRNRNRSCLLFFSIFVWNFTRIVVHFARSGPKVRSLCAFELSANVCGAIVAFLFNKSRTCSRNEISANRLIPWRINSEFPVFNELLEFNRAFLFFFFCFFCRKWSCSRLYSRVR